MKKLLRDIISTGKNVITLNGILLALVGWLRYLLGIKDNGEYVEISSDPQKETLQKELEEIKVGRSQSYK